MTYQVYSGKLLVATPQIDDDPTFKQSIVYITEEKDETVYGFVLNKPSSLSVSQVMHVVTGEQSVGNEQKMHMGGPVHQESLFLLHSNEWYSKLTKQLDHGLAVSSDEVMVDKVLMGNLPKDYKLIGGISTWHPRQLAMEIHKGGWLLVNEPPMDLIFTHTGKVAWTKAVELAGSEAIDAYF